MNARLGPTGRFWELCEAIPDETSFLFPFFIVENEEAALTVLPGNWYVLKSLLQSDFYFRARGIYRKEQVTRSHIRILSSMVLKCMN